MDDLYKARKGNIQFSIQPDMIEAYSIAGYEIIKLEEVVVQDVAKELNNIQNLSYTARIGGNA